jgi:hypothetical protein
MYTPAEVQALLVELEPGRVERTESNAATYKFARSLRFRQ